MAIKQQVAFVDATDTATIALIQADCIAKDGEANLCIRPPGPAVFAGVEWEPADVDPCEAVVYTLAADTETLACLQRLGITPRSIDALTPPGP